MKFNKKDYINISILLILLLTIVFLIVGDNINGSTVDWNSQHWIIPEYFRNLFYDTNDLFPSFAFNLGAGENIYNLSYYGLLNPLILISYLLPFIKMIDYIQVSMLFVVGISIVLMYYWLRKRFDSKYSFIGTLLFSLSAPLIYHTHRHIMFINYMPFLLLGLISVDRYFDRGKKTLLAISTFLIIMTSYYYSVGALICIVLYGIYRYIENNEKIKITTFFVDGFRFLFPIIIGIGLSGLLICPTFYALLNGRNDITNGVNIYKILVPTLNINQILYNSYTIGLTSIFVFSILWGLFKKRSIRYLSIVFGLLLVFPIFIYALSGFMYERGKVLIPLLPIAILLVTYVLNKITVRENKVFNYMLIIISLIEIYIHIKNNQIYFILDVVILIISYFIYLKSKNKRILIYPLCICAFICCIGNNYTDKLESRDYYNIQNDYSNYERLSKIIDNEETLHRVSNDILGMSNSNRVVDTDFLLPTIYSSLENTNYYDFANNMIYNEMENRISTGITSSKNILFNTFMSTKYMITKSVVPIGYNNIIGTDIYYNDNVLPIGYATSKLMSYEEYEKLDNINKVEALMTNIITNTDVESNYSTKLNLEETDYEYTYENLSIETRVDEYVINALDNAAINIDLNKKYDNKILLISFDMKYSESCLIGDTSITINGIKNTLSCKGWTYPNKNNTFEYAISSNESIEELNIELSKGKYEITNIKMYSIDYDYITDYVNSVNEFEIDKNKTKGDYIVGEINVSENGYFILTVPYEEKGFEIYLDNKKVDYEKVNTTFIGFPIHEGSHKISIKYTSPYLKEGIIITLCSSMIMLPILYTDLFIKKKRK